MKSCQQISFAILVTAAEGGTLDEGSTLTQGAAWHLRHCAGCRDTVALLRDQADALRRLASTRVGLDLRERILRRARRAAQERLTDTLRAVLRQAARGEAREREAASSGAGATPGAEATSGGGPSHPAARRRAGRTGALLVQVATLQRRLAQLGEVLDLDGLTETGPDAPDLAQRTLELLVRLEGLTTWRRRSARRRPSGAGPARSAGLRVRPPGAPSSTPVQRPRAR